MSDSVVTPVPGTDPNRLRIDDLARQTGLTVDTVRYYQREGLLPPGEREGRHRTYGPEHVRRIKRIKELQGRRFSIAAIRALVSGDGTRLTPIFADEGEDLRLGFDELVERSDADPDLVAALQAAGILRDPAAFGRTSYDGDDLEMLRAMADAHSTAVPVSALQAFGRIYAEGIEATQRRIVDVFVDGSDAGLSPAEVEALRTAARAGYERLFAGLRRLVDYTVHRTIQRLILDTVASAADPEGDPDATDPALTIP